MGSALDARTAIFQRVTSGWPKGFDAAFVSPRLKTANSLVSVQWSVDPELGLPVAPFEILVEEEVSRTNLESTFLERASLDSGNGFSLLVPASAPAERVLYVRGEVAQASSKRRIFALDQAGVEIRESAQLVAAGDSFIFFGPDIIGIGSDDTAVLGKIYVAVIPQGLSGEKVGEAAPPFDVPIYEQLVEGPGRVSAKSAVMWRLQSNTFARAADPGPQQPDLLREVHLEDIVASAHSLQLYKPLNELENNFAQALLDPNWNYVETEIGGGSAAEATIYPVRILQLVRTLGPIEASVLGFEVTVPSRKGPVLSRSDLLNRIVSEALLPFTLVRVIGYFAKPGFVDTGNISDNKTSSFTRVVETWARLTFFDQSVNPTASVGELNDPTMRDQSATVDVDITLTYAGWLETTYLARNSPDGVIRDQDRPKLFTYRAFRRDGSNAKDPWLSDPSLPAPNVDPTEIKHLIYRRDEFGRWAEALLTSAELAPYPVEPPTIASVEVRYEANARIFLELVVSRSWKLRTPFDISIALAISLDPADATIVHLRPPDGVTSPLLGNRLPLSIEFDLDGQPIVRFSGGPPTPIVVADQTGAGLPELRSYTLTVPLLDAQDVVGESMFVGVTADASNVVSGPARRSKAASTQIRKFFDPRPPVVASKPWQLVWSSRPNPRGRTRLLLDPPVATSGEMGGFRIWQATETALIDFALEEAQSSTEKDDIERLAKLLRRTTDMRLRAQLLKNRISPLLVDDNTKAAFFSKFDAVSDKIWGPEEVVELEVSARIDGLVALLFTGISKSGVENLSLDVSTADLRVYAVPDRIPDKAPIIQVVADLDGSGAIPNCCLIVAGSRQPVEARALRLFWDNGDDVDNEQEVLYELDNRSELSDAQARDYLDDIDDLVGRMELPFHLIFLVVLPESWSRHHFTADILRTSIASPADQIPSPRATMVSCVVRPGLGPILSVVARHESYDAVDWTVKYTGLTLLTPSGYSPSEVYLEVSDGSAKQGPTSLSEVLTNGMVLPVPGGSINLDGIEGDKLKITANPPPVGFKVRLFVKDPAARVAKVELA
ncbi:MAG TPA: hypothetical protein VMT72_02165 [Pseudolabrys sp.]|nr:hypothetical protein [Pseudolabrys sp.]